MWGKALIKHGHPLVRKEKSDAQRWERPQAIIENLRRQPPSRPGSTMTLWHFSESSKSDKPPHAVWRTTPDRSLSLFCLLFGSVPFYVVERFALSISSLQETETRSQASSVIPQCPVTAVSGVRTCGCRYPILNLCHSAPTDQQSNFTQARSDWGNADAGMRIYASTKSRKCLKWLEGCWSWGKRWAEKWDRNNDGGVMEGDGGVTWGVTATGSCRISS